MADELGPVYDLIARRLLKGKIVPVLGATTNYDDSLERAFADEGEPYERRFTAQWTVPTERTAS
ncbi:MAG: hypothetical protein ACRDSZ_21140 [Pseudonocardiaceae bacterium]